MKDGSPDEATSTEPDLAFTLLENAVNHILNSPQRHDLPFSPSDFVGVEPAAIDPHVAAAFVETVDQTFDEVYRQHVQPRLVMLRQGRLRSFRRYATEPVAYVLESARLLSYWGLGAIAVAPENRRHYAVDVAAWVTIGRASALLMDDVVDRSTERMNRPSALARYGRVRCIAAFFYTLMAGLRFAIFRSPGEMTQRIRRALLSVEMLAVGLSTQKPWHQWSFDARCKAGRHYYASVWWILLAPSPRDPRTNAPAVKEMVGHFSLATKVLNDLRDYYGRGTKAAFEDFHAHRVTFPVLLVSRSDMSAEDRTRFTAHYVERADGLDPEGAVSLFERHGIRQAATSLALQELRSAWDLSGRPSCLPSVARDFIRTLILYVWAQAINDADLFRSDSTAVAGPSR